MLTRTCLIGLLACQLGLAAPPPPVTHLERPGAYLAPLEVEQLLNRCEKAASNNPHARLELECRRLMPLLRKFAPGCPPRVARIREQVETLPAGPVRARCYWVLCWDSIMRNQSVEANRYARQALAEPGLTPVQRAFWMDELDAAYCGQLDPDLRSSMVAEVSSLNKRQPDPGLLYILLALRSRTARIQGQQDVENTFLLASLQIAQKEGWLAEQIKVRLVSRQFSQQDDRLWPELMALVLRQPKSLRRDGLLRWVMSVTPSAQDWEQARSQLQKPLSTVEVQRAQLGFLKGDALVEMYNLLIRSCQQAGDVEEEIAYRYRLSNLLESTGRLEASLRQMQAALQCRQDHPLDDPAWTPNRMDYLAQMLCRKLEKCGRTQQQAALARQTLEQGWCDKPSRQVEFHLQLCDLAQRLGDHERELAHWQGALELVPHLEVDIRGYILYLLAKMAPPEKVHLRSDLLKQARVQAESVSLQSNYSDRSNALVTLHEILQLQGDTSALIKMWQEEMRHAGQVGDTSSLRNASFRLMKLYAKAERPQDLKELASARLQESDVPWERAAIYSFAPDLARVQDPQALVWADQGVQLARKAPISIWNLPRALLSQARVLAEFQRFPAALSALEEAERQKPVGSQLVEWLEARAEVLWKQGRQSESVAQLRDSLTAVLASEQPGTARPGLHKLAYYQEQLGQDWQAEFENAVRHLQGLGERGQGPRQQLLFDWLERLADKQQWEQGRQVLQRYPWGPGMDSSMQKLQDYPQWSDLLPQPPSTGNVDPQSLPALLDALRLENSDLGQLLTLRSTNLKHLQQRLGPKDTLVTYCQRGEEIYLLALRHDRGFWRKSQLSRARLKEMLALYLRELSTDQPGSAESSLQAMLLAPVLGSEPDQCLYLVPTGDLWQVPFGALRDSQGKSAASQADVVLLSSGDLLRMADRSWQPYRLTQPLAIGAPSAIDLPGAYRELEEVAQVLPGCLLRRGDQATTEVLYAPNQRWGLLHFASHAHYNLRQPLESEIELKDGPLKLKQLSQLSLAEHSLVTLSCCQGGAASGQKLDEPVTLATGFSAAGAETVVANLWQVDDTVARVFFTDFYTQLAGGATPLLSFRHAQENCRRLYPSARDWGGFFLLGNPT